MEAVHDAPFGMSTRAPRAETTVAHEESWVTGNADRGSAAPLGWLAVIPVSMLVIVGLCLAVVNVSHFTW